MYSAIPFVEEIRSLTDWTVTKTSLDFFMWMKLEDAQQGLYRTKRDMETRRWVTAGAARPNLEKLCQGGLLLIVLFILIVAPIAMFSGLNPALKSNILTSASLTGSLLVQSGNSGIRRLVLYKAEQASISPASDQTFDESQIDVSEVFFPTVSDSFLYTSADLQVVIARTLEAEHAEAWFQLEFSLEFNGDSSINGNAKGSKRVAFSSNQTAALSAFLSNGSISTDLLISGAISSTVRVSSRMDVTSVPPLCNLQLTIRDSVGYGFGMSQRNDASCICNTVNPATNGIADQQSCAIHLLVASEKVAPNIVSTGSTTSGSSWSVIGIYLGVVYAVGRFLRLIFQDASKRIIYEELPNTSLLLDLCNGIYIARIQRLLQTEYKLYHQLLHIYRSPELLLNVSRTTDDTEVDAADTDEQDTDLGSELRRTPKPQGWNVSSSLAAHLSEDANSEPASGRDDGGAAPLAAVQEVEVLSAASDERRSDCRGSLWCNTNAMNVDASRCTSAPAASSVHRFTPAKREISLRPWDAPREADAPTSRNNASSSSANCLIHSSTERL